MRDTARYIKYLSIIAGLFLLAGCVSKSSVSDLFSEPLSRTTVVLVDTSGSISAEDRQLYIDTLRGLGRSLRAGDSLIVANISDRDRSAFRPTLDLHIPKTDIRLDREESERKARSQVEAQAPSLIPGRGSKGSSTTRILDMIAASAQAFGSAPFQLNSARIVLLSDGVEESSVVDLSKAHGGQSEVDQEIQLVKSARLLPDLREAEFAVVGAGGKNYTAIEEFWRAYSAATGANIVSYGRLAFPRPQ